jgi:hypothetical protein
MLSTATTNPRLKNICDSEVQARTGLDWKDWHTILDSWNAHSRRLRDTITQLKATYKLSQFWAQAIATHYMLQRLKQ